MTHFNGWIVMLMILLQSGISPIQAEGGYIRISGENIFIHIYSLTWIYRPCLGWFFLYNPSKNSDVTVYPKLFWSRHAVFWCSKCVKDHTGPGSYVFQRVSLSKFWGVWWTMGERSPIFRTPFGAKSHGKVGELGPRVPEMTHWILGFQSPSRIYER
jgi:hypothetical protein